MEKISWSWVKTVFIPNDQPPISQIMRVELASVLSSVCWEEGIAECLGSIWVLLEYQPSAENGWYCPKGDLNSNIAWDRPSQKEACLLEIELPFAKDLTPKWDQSVWQKECKLILEEANWQQVASNALEISATFAIVILETPAETVKSVLAEQNATGEICLNVKEDEAKYIVVPQESLSDAVKKYAIKETVLEENFPWEMEDIEKTEAEIEVAKIKEVKEIVIEQEKKITISQTALEAETKVSEPSPKSTSRTTSTQTVGNEYRMKFYLVQEGEDLEAVAQRHNISSESLKGANQVSEEALRTGMLLNIPK